MRRRSPAAALCDPPAMTTIPEPLIASCRRDPRRLAWLDRLPQAICELQARWSLTLGPVLSGSESTCAWIAPAVRLDGTRAVLKIGMPHIEGLHEIDGLRFWNGEPTVRLLEGDAGVTAMLLERCEPGTSLRGLREDEQDRVIAGLLHRLWRKPPASHPFRPLSAMIGYWAEETSAAAHTWNDPGLVREGLSLFDELSRASSGDVLLATDLHAGNVLRAEREPWLVIDPKPFVGDRAYDATQHLFNCRTRLLANPLGTIRRFADLLEVDHERVRLWMFARSAAEPRDSWDERSVEIARALA